MMDKAMFYKIIIKSVFLLLVFSSTAHAHGYLSSLDDPQISVTGYFTHSNGAITLFVSGISSNPDGCNNTNRVHLKADHPGFKSISSSALAALAAGKKIGIYSSGCELIPFWGGTQTRPIIRELWVVN